MKKEHYDILNKYDEKLDKALHGNYCRFTPSEFDEVAIVFKEMYGVAVTQAERNCSTCKMRILKQLGRAFVEAKKQYSAAKNIAPTVNRVTDAVMNVRESIEQATEAAACVAEVAAVAKAKRGRKKKTQPADK